ncbi:NADH-ubiquinone oxidoreductase-F iron-sulfur binding region domain-containing protein [Aurantiacibacter poecillastricola]|uniref:NADH-ubiquinone oxidoreductase-F iron-sulfur binding region domain-containing protein n=1 Tax=Aurantiacibacter poecillastricola TaxID=3064385 RepID=UPI00273E8592|nr:NADH-ubiquinone oxidoreductase-F iron-sulfur binding region domain-containing protein [Aurantiacibacter sp. 219JJ12-13]MDP5260155.1 NADH-ubiquinone oxidoreductase-F iron-sulfur binding region domain-containing protein [Aurantiacibacter sp. 219JJ12-13]
MTTVRISDDALARAGGADRLAAAFEKKGCEVQRTSSWGMHWLEPLVEIDGEGFGPATLDDVDAILDGRSNKSIGNIEDHPFIATQTRITFKRAGKTRPLSLEDYEATGGWVGLKRAREIGSAAIVDEIKHSGLRGRGGAGFPTGIKWETVMKAPGPQKYIVCNADEGDSGTFADRMAMEGDPFALLEGMAIAGEAVGANQGYIYLRSEYPDAIRKLNAAIEIAAHIIAPFKCEVRVGAGAYVCGEETSLLNSLEGKRGEVRAKPPLPALEGFLARPTVVNNVLSLQAVPHILHEGGADEYRDAGFGRSRGTMPIQLAGNIKHGGLYEVGFGVTLDDLVNQIGGGTASGRPVKAVQVGGPLGAYIHPDQFDIKFDYEEYTNAEALIGHGGVTVFDDSADMLEMARFAMEFCSVESCGKCTPCRIGAVRGVEILDRIKAGGRTRDRIELAPQMHNAPKDAGRDAGDEIGLLTDLCETMKFGSLCALGGFTPYPVMSALRQWPEDFTRNPELVKKALPEAAE